MPENNQFQDIFFSPRFRQSTLLIGANPTAIFATPPKSYHLNTATSTIPTKVLLKSTKETVTRISSMSGSTI